MLNVYLLRHGETQWNADGNRYCGRTDIPLTKKGISQADSVHEQIKDIDFSAVYSSPLQRAKHTAQIASGNQEVVTDERLIEIDFGNWEGKTREEFIAEAPALWNSWSNDPGITKAGGTGETANEVVTRVNNFFEFLLKKFPSGNVLVVGHNGINRFYLAFKLSMQLKNYRRLVQQNSSITMFTLDPQNDELSLKLLNSRLWNPIVTANLFDDALKMSDFVKKAQRQSDYSASFRATGAGQEKLPPTTNKTRRARSASDEVACYTEPWWKN